MKLGLLIKRILPLLMFAVLLFVVPTATPQDRAKVSIGTALNDPNSFTGQIIRTYGIFQVLKEQLRLYDNADKAEPHAWITFDNGWKNRSSKSVVKELDRLINQSGTSWPYRGLSVIQLEYRYAYVDLEGVVSANSEYRNPAKEHSDDDNFMLTFPINTAPYILTVHRILSLQERKANSR